MGREKSGQVWSLDYVIGLLLFIAALVISGSLLSRTLVQENDFGDVLLNAERLSEHAMSTGYPVHWRADDVVVAGLLTENQLSIRKLERLATLAENNYTTSKNILNIKYEYAFTLQNRTGQYLPIGDDCYFGSTDFTEQKTSITAQQRVAYYHRTSNSLAAFLTSVNASIYSDGQLGTLLNNLTRIDLLIMEEPNLGSISPPYEGEKQQLLEDFVLRGGTLLLIGNVNHTHAFNLNTSPSNLTTVKGTFAIDSFLNLTGEVVENLVNPYNFTPAGQRNNESLAKFQGTATDFAVHFSHGDGEVYYLGSLSGTINSSGESLLNHTISQLNETIHYDSATCTSTAPPAGTRHLVVLERLVAHEGEILTLTVTAWSER